MSSENGMFAPIYEGVSGLGSVVSLHDVDDVERYTAGTLRKVLPGLGASEREELESECLAILFDLAGEWNGRDSFRRFASSRLGFRLIDARRTLNRGSRSKGFRPCLSLDSERARPGFDESRVRRMGDFARTPVAT